MLTIRLSRTGKRKQPYYRVVLQEKTRDPWSPAIEVLGNLDPRKDRSEIVLDEERVKHWLSKGAQPSTGLYNLFVEKGWIKGEKVQKVHLTKARRAAMAEAKAATAKAAADKEEAKKAAAEEAKKAKEAEVAAPAPEATPEVAPEAAPAPEAQA